MMQQLTKQQKQYIRHLYTETSQLGAARGLKSFYHMLKKQGKIPRDVKYSEFHDTFQTFSPWNKFTEFRRPHHQIWQHYKSFNIDAEFAVDVGVMPKNSKAYAGFFAAVNVCTRLVAAEPIRKRKKEDIIKALDTIIRKTGVTPQFIYTDKEPAIGSRDFKDYAKSKGIEIVYTNSLHKVGLAEREVKYIKQSLAKYVDQDVSNDWARYLPVVVDNQNNTFNKEVGGVPSQINIYNVWHYVEKKYGPLEKFDKWYQKEKKAQQYVQQRRHKKLQAKDRYLFVGQPVYINSARIQLLQDSRDSTVKRSQTG